MDSDQLNVKVTVDASQIGGVLEPAAERAKDEFSRLAEAQIRVSTASRELNSLLSQLSKGGLAPTAEQTEEVAAAMWEAKTAATALAAAEEAAYGPTQQLATGAHNARAAFMGLNRELGLGGNRALSTFISQSETLGPLLSQAFTGIAIAGFIQLAVLAGEKLANLISETFIFTEAQKQLYTEELGANKAIADANDQHAKMLREIAMLGLPIEQQQKMRLQYAKEDADGLAGSISQQEKALDVAREQLRVLEEKAKTPVMIGETRGVPIKALPDMSSAIAAQERAIDSLNAKIGVLRAQYTVAMDAVAEATKKGSIDTTKDAQKEQELWAREQERLGHEQEEAAIKRGDAERHELEEKERLDEEMAATSAETAKKDLEAWQRALVEKTRTIEEQGKAQLDQIRRSAEIAEKSTADKSLLGNANPAIAGEARAAAEQQVAVIQRMVAAEEQLQATLKQTGAAQDDPKIQESLRREAELTQQISKAWDDYKKKVEQVATAQTTFVKGEFNSLFSSVNSNLVQMVNGQESISRGLQKIWTGLVDGIIVDFARLGEKWIMQHVIMAAASKLFHLQDAADETVSTTAAVAAAKVKALAQVSLAGAGGVASMAAAPFPLDLTAPSFGASMAAAAASMLAFEKGGIVPGFGAVPAIVHGGEMILNQDQQRALGNGGHTFHFNNYGSGAPDQVRDSGREFMRLAKRAMRRAH